MLPARGPQAYGSFTHALSQDGYTHISQHLEEALTQSKKDQQGVETKCTPTNNNDEIRKLKFPPDGAVLHRKQRREQPEEEETSKT